MYLRHNRTEVLLGNSSVSDADSAVFGILLLLGKVMHEVWAQSCFRREQLRVSDLGLSVAGLYQRCMQSSNIVLDQGQKRSMRS